MPLYTLDRGPIAPTVVALTRPLPVDGGFTGLVGQALRDLGGVNARLDTIARPITDTGGANPDSDLSGHEADLVASQRADRATLSTLYATDELHGGDAVNLGADGTLGDLRDVQSAHTALSPRIDSGASEIPHEPVIMPDDQKDHPRDWPHPPKDADQVDPHR
jgi:hypothetical protein